jgi:hypothetical protein
VPGSRQSLNADICACFTQTQTFPLYEGRMTASVLPSRPSPRLAAALLALGLLLALGFGLAGCAEMNDGLTVAFADPAKYDLYDCKQLEAERKSLAGRAAELQGLMEKAQAGVAGPVVSELAYRNEYISVRGQAKLADEAWRRNKCKESASGVATPAAPAPAPDKSAHSHTRSGNAVY